MDLIGNVGRCYDHQDSRDGPQVNVEQTFIPEVLSRDISESILVVSVRRQLVYHGLEIEQMPKEE